MNYQMDWKGQLQKAGSAGPLPDIVYMPWASLKDEVRMGEVLFSPWKLTRDKLSNNSQIEYLDWLFSLYVDLRGNEVDSVATCHLKSRRLEAYNDNEIALLFEAMSALAFCFVYPSITNAVESKNRSLGPPSSDRFITYARRVLDDKVIVLAHSGSMQVWPANENIRIGRPTHVINGAFPQFRQDLCDGFGKALFSQSLDPNKRRRLFRALDWFRLAHTSADEVPWKTKAVFMCTAFETLLDIQGNNKAAELADYLDKHIDSGGLEEMRTDSRNKPIERTKKAFWGWEFYGIRNQIVHGNEIRAQKLWYSKKDIDWLNHLIVSAMVFGQCVTYLLQEEGFIQKADDLEDVYKLLEWVS